MIVTCRAFDPEKKGYIEADLLKALVQAKGETFTTQEASNMLG